MKKVVFTFVIIYQTLGFSQNLEGMEGLFFIPSAEIRGDSKITFGTNYLDKSIVSFGAFGNSAENYFLTINFLPFVEASLRITRLRGLPSVNTQAIGDRTPSIKVKFFEETKFFPAIAIGLHDIFTVFGGETAVHNSAFYGVATKNLKLGTVISSLSVTMGYGTDFLDATNHNFVGIFGGFSLRIMDSIDFIFEYDSERSNSAVRAKLFDHLNMLIGVLKYKYISAGLSYSFSL